MSIFTKFLRYKNLMLYGYTLLNSQFLRLICNFVGFIFILLLHSELFSLGANFPNFTNGLTTHEDLFCAVSQ